MSIRLISIIYVDVFFCSYFSYFAHKYVYLFKLIQEVLLYDLGIKMKIKEIEQTAHLAWSPSSMFPVYLATGTAAQQLDASFSTTAQLDLYSLDLGEPGLDMTCKASIPTKHRYYYCFHLVDYVLMISFGV